MRKEGDRLTYCHVQDFVDVLTAMFDIENRTLESRSLTFFADQFDIGQELHFDDINKLLASFRHLIEAGGSLIVIEHNLDVIKTADWIIDLGPEGGDQGGEVIATGTPEDLKAIQHSYTGRFLKMQAGGG